MNARHIVLSAIIGIAGAFVTGVSNGQTTASGPYYAVPSWDQQLPASTRFVILSNWNNAAVLDRETGLVWQRTPGGEFAGLSTQPYEAATQLCAQAKTGGRLGWRLPSLEEALSLADPGVLSTTGSLTLGLPAGHPFTNVPMNESFWTLTSRALFPSDVWAVNFTLFPTQPGRPPTSCCGVTAGMPKSEPHKMWCVRGPGPIQTN
jgi:hypothetical protein